jgi:hypothetical protein
MFKEKAMSVKETVKKLNAVANPCMVFNGVHYCPVVGNEGKYPVIKFLDDEFVMTATGIVKVADWHFADGTHDEQLITYYRKVSEVPLCFHAKQISKRDDVVIIVF